MMMEGSINQDYCPTCDGPTLPWCGHQKPTPIGPCSATIEVPLVRDDQEGPVAHFFLCAKRIGHAGNHLAHVQWGDPEQ